MKDLKTYAYISVRMEPYTKECGCCCHDWVEDVDRPFVSYTDRGTTVIS